MADDAGASTPRAPVTSTPASSSASLGDHQHGVVGVVGLGYVGLPLAVALAEAGLTVIGVDVDQRKVDSLAAGESYIEDISSERLRAVGDRLSASKRYADLSGASTVVIAVPTPL